MVFGVQVKSSTGVTELLRAYIAEDLQNGDAIMRLDAKDFGIIRIVVVAELAVLTVLP